MLSAKNKARIMTASVIFVIAALLAVPVFADSLAINFESPLYTLGSVNGQDGWSSTGPFDQAIVNNTYGYPSFGDQSLRISNAVTSGSYGNQTFSKPLTDEAGETTASNGSMSGGTRQNYFEAQWDFASTVPGEQQPGLSVVASPDRGDGARMSWVQMTDTPTGLEVNFYDYQGGTVDPPLCDGTFVFTNVASGLDRTIPHTIKVTMQFVDGPANDVVKVYVDGVLAHTGTSWEDFFRQCQPTTPITTSRTVDSVLFRVGGSCPSFCAPATFGKGFLIDNLSLTSSTTVGPPTTEDQCKKDGWKTFNTPRTFKNQGDCIQYVNTGK